MFEVAEGSKGSELEQRHRYSLTLLHMGVVFKFIPLNGGSDTRRAAREHYFLYALNQGLPYEGRGCMVKLGSYGFKRGKGMRFVMHKTPGFTALFWCDHRKAKRLCKAKNSEFSFV